MFWWGALGLLVPAVLLMRWKLFGAMFGQVEAIVWPSSIITLGLEGNPGLGAILLVHALAILANVLAYSLMGLLVWPVARLFLRQSSEQDE